FQADPRSNKVRTNAKGEQEILMWIDPYSVQGKHLHGVHSGFDPKDGSPNVSFTMSGRGANLFGRLTGDNLPKNEINHHSLLGIVLDRRLISAPRIQSRISEQGEISGNFTEAEVKDLAAVLNSGRLPAVLKPNPISEMKVSPLLGVDTIKKGQVAIVASLVSVLIFMMIYYQFAGLVAGIALLINLLLVFSIVTIIKASITMPGLAGIVLTVGMSIDSSVLIFERIREELARGCALRMAIRNGFSRATATIVDSNLTTLITAFVLYAIGTDMVKGFAVILILGILTSMFTAIFCARLVFDLAERMRWISTLRMFQLLVSPNLPVMNFSSRCMVGSAILMVASVVALGYRGKQAFDTDFNGGTRVQVAFKESIPVEQVKQRVAKMADSYAVFQVNSAEKTKDTEYIIDTSLQDLDQLKGLIATAFVGPNQVTQLVCHVMDFEPAQEVNTRPADGDAPKKPTEGQGSQVTVDGAFQYVRRADLPPDTMLAQADTNADASTETSAPSTVTTDSVVSTPSTEEAAAPAQPAPSTATTDSVVNTPFTEEAVVTEQAVEATTPPFHSSSKLSFDEPISRESIEPKLRELAQSMEIADLEFELTAVGSASGDGESAKVWQLQSTASSQQLTQLLEKYRSSVMEEPVWYGSSMIGSRVAGDMKNKALMAFLVSCIGITGYVWVRFHRIVYGLAAVAALVHDVVITVGAVAASVWLAQWFGFLQVGEFKISLPIVAAVLTVMGYSINDTIVVFDRIREVKGRSPLLTEPMLNGSINETLSRTAVTSFTTLLSVVFLYFLGGEGVHGFAFALLVGIVVGTYSSIFIASPLLLWLSKFRYFQ
ncbi:MAG: protein translocase subunit SecD, partial [Planctomycetota bacterium]|nr:protein translocase subunit SecD [Planctomycetota bacterium]